MGVPLRHRLILSSVVGLTAQSELPAVFSEESGDHCTPAHQLYFARASPQRTHNASASIGTGAVAAAYRFERNRPTNRPRIFHDQWTGFGSHGFETEPDC